MVGTRLSHYAIGKLLGEGGMGVVYRAVDTRLNRTVAVKVLAAGIVHRDIKPANIMVNWQAR